MTLENSLRRLLKEGKLSRQKTSIGYLNNLINASKRNFLAAAIVKDEINEAAFKLCYDGLLQIGRVILLENGFRPADGEQHKTTFAVAGEILGDDFHDLIRKLQKYRIKRNNCIYDPNILISSTEAENIHITAQEFWRKVKVYLANKNPQLSLFDEL